MLDARNAAHYERVRVRPAIRSDAQTIEDLYRGLVPGDNNIHVSPQRIADLESDGHNFLLVIEVEAQVCGTAFLTVCLDPMYGFQPYGVVENVVISPAHHGRGLGGALMAAIEMEARDQKCTKLMLQSSVTRAKAHAFFAKIGFDGAKKRAFVKYLNRPDQFRSSGGSEEA